MSPLVSDRVKGIFKPPFDKVQPKSDESSITLSVDCVIFGLKDQALNVLLIKSDFPGYLNRWSLLGDIVESDENLDEAAYRVLKERTGLDHLYLEQVQTFGKVDRHPAGRVITVAYYSLVNIDQLDILKHDNELHWHKIENISDLAFDHTEILNVCLQRLRVKIRTEPVGFKLLPENFTLRELQSLYESVLSVTLDRRNFRKKFFSTGLLIDLGKYELGVRHRPARLYNFDFEQYNLLQDKTIQFW